MAAPAGSPAATTTRYAHVKMLPRSAMHQMCEAFDIVIPDGSDAQGGVALAILVDRLSASTPAADTFSRALGDGAGTIVRAQGYHLLAWRSCVASWRTRSSRLRHQRLRLRRRPLWLLCRCSAWCSVDSRVQISPRRKCWRYKYCTQKTCCKKTSLP